jgi:hypothetical protein
MKPHDLRFKWDPYANKESTDKSPEKNLQKEPKRLEDYFDFIEQFTFSSDENKPDEHVDKKFSLSL